MPKEIRLRITLQNPVEGTIYGLQHGKGPNYETLQPQPGNGHDLTFNFTVAFKETNGVLSTLTGPFVQGPAGNRFVYIVIGKYAGQIGAPWSGRMKVPLPEATFQNKLSDERDSIWCCTVPGRNEVGKPVFATVKSFGGWSLRKQSE